MPSVTIDCRRRFVRFTLATLALSTAASAAHAQAPAVVAVPGRAALLLSAFDLAPLGYSTEEFFFSGTASSYKLSAEPTADGRWNAVAAESAPYATRMVVVKPTDASKFNGTVVVEWLNVSAGADGSPDWNAAHRELIRSGYAYVGVSAQKVGVEGGTSATPTASGASSAGSEPAWRRRKPSQ